MPNVTTIRAEDVKEGDFVVYAGRGHEVLRVQRGAAVGLQLDRGAMVLERGAGVVVVEECER
jgi:hypothetical protein